MVHKILETGLASSIEGEEIIEDICFKYMKSNMSTERISTYKSLDRIVSEKIYAKPNENDVFELSGYGTYILNPKVKNFNSDLLIEKSTIITSNHIASLYLHQVDEVSVLAEPRFLIMSLKNKYLSSGNADYNIDKYIINNGGHLVGKKIIDLSKNNILTSMKQASKMSDVLIISNTGLSIDSNRIKALLENTHDGKILHSSIRLINGNSIIVGKLFGKLLVYLSGDIYTDTYACELIVNSFLNTWMYREYDIKAVNAILSTDIVDKTNMKTIQLVELSYTDGKCYAKPINNKTNLSDNHSKANGYFIKHYKNNGVHKGDSVFVILFNKIIS